MFYAVALDELSFLEIKAALTKVVRTARFFPTIAEIIEAAEDFRQTVEGDTKLSAGEAWEEAMRLVKTCHMYKPWTFSTPEVEQAVNQFGKLELIELDKSAMNTARAQFMKIYNGVVEKQRAQNHNKRVLQAMGKDVAGLIRSTAELKRLR